MSCLVGMKLDCAQAWLVAAISALLFLAPFSCEESWLENESEYL